MRTRKSKTALVGGMAAAGLLLLGCNSNVTSGGLATLRVALARADAPSMAVMTEAVSTAGPVDLSNVSALSVDLDSVQLQTSGSGQWQTVIPPGAPLTLNLVTDLATAIDLGSVTVESGTCEARLFVSNPMITFTNDIVFGQHTVTAGTYPVRIPSGPQTGLKADGTCDATDGAHVTLAFDVGASVGTIVATGNGDILLTPVIHVRQP